MNKFLVNRLIKLVTKHGMKMVLEALVYVASTHHEEYMQRLVYDLNVAIKNFDDGRKKKR